MTEPRMPAPPRRAWSRTTSSPFSRSSVSCARWRPARPPGVRARHGMSTWPPLRPSCLWRSSKPPTRCARPLQQELLASLATTAFRKAARTTRSLGGISTTLVARRVALLQRAADRENRRYADLLSALMCDVAEKDDKIEATPLCLLFGQGHQHFLDRLATVPQTEAPPSRGRGRKAVSLTAAKTLQEALFVPWTRQDPTPAFRWDPAEDVRYALRATTHPAKNQPPSMAPIGWLRSGFPSSP